MTAMRIVRKLSLFRIHIFLKQRIYGFGGKPGRKILSAKLRTIANDSGFAPKSGEA